MGSRNGYFQIIDREDGTYLKIFPALELGTPLKVDELVRYLSRQRIEGYNLPQINQVLKSATEETEIKLSDSIILPISEEIKIHTEIDKMSAIGRFYPPSSKGKLIDKNEIMNNLKCLGIVFGIQEDVIDEFIKNRKYCEDLVLAKGSPVVNGRDAKITYHFNLNLNSKPKLNDDGTVDFHHLENINKVSVGTILATLTPEILGRPGSDVFGKEIPPKKVEKRRLKYGRNINLSEDSLQLISAVSGHVEIDYEGKVIVSNTYEVAGDVDASTGDIQYEGNVFVKGNVRTGFSITASGDIEINGVVEGAQIIAGGQIVLRRGIQGMNKGVLDAKGNIVAKFIESAKVKAGGAIETDCILHSTVSANGEIILKGKRGLLIGGNVRSSRQIEAQNIGSAMGTSTVVEVGADPGQQDELLKLQEEEKKLREEEYRLRQVVDMLKAKQERGQLATDKISEFKGTLQRYIAIYNRIKEVSKEIIESTEALMADTDARIKVSKNIYPGVKIIVGGEVLITRDIRSFSQFVKSDGEVKILTL